MADNSTYFTTTEIQYIMDAGFPTDYKPSIYKLWEAFESKFGGTVMLGSGNAFTEFLTFIGHVKNISSGSQAANLGALTRAMHLEIANFSTDRINSVNGVSDCLTNRLISNMAANYMSAAVGLNGLNPVRPEYWHSIMRQPIPDAMLNGQVGLDGLVTSYKNAFIMFCNENRIYPWFYGVSGPSAYTRFSSLPTGYNYFNETDGTGRIKIGKFYFRQNF